MPLRAELTRTSWVYAVVVTAACTHAAGPKARSEAEWVQELNALVPLGTASDSATARLRELGFACTETADSTTGFFCKGPARGTVVQARLVATLQTSGNRVVAVTGKQWLTGP